MADIILSQIIEASDRNDYETVKRLTEELFKEVE